MKACPRCGKVWRGEGRSAIVRAAHQPECDQLLTRHGEFATVAGVRGSGEGAWGAMIGTLVQLLQAAGWSGRQARGLILLRHAPTEDGTLVPVWVMAPAWMVAVILTLPFPAWSKVEEHPVTLRRLRTLRRAGHEARARMATTYRLGGAAAAVELCTELDRLHPPEHRE